MAETQSQSPSILDRVLQTAQAIGMGYLDYKIADRQTEAARVLSFGADQTGQMANQQSAYGINGTGVYAQPMPQWVVPVALLGFAGLLVWKVAK